MESQQPTSPHDRPTDHASGLRKVALASVAALAVVLPLAAATDAPHAHAAHTGHRDQTAVDHPHARTSSADGYGPLPRSGGTS